MLYHCIQILKFRIKTVHVQKSRKQTIFFYKSSHIQPFNHLVSEKSTNSIQPTSLYSFSSSNPEKRTQNYGLMVTWIQPELFICLLILFCFIFASSVCALHYEPHLLFCFEVQKDKYCSEHIKR